MRISSSGQALLVLLLAAIPGPSAVAQQAFFMGLGDLPGGAIESQVRDISRDGQVVVGYSAVEPRPTGERFDTFRWTRATGMMGLNAVDSLEPRFVSGDGSTIVGSAESRRAFRWSQTTGLEGLPPIAMSGASRTNSVSGDGSRIVGSYEILDSAGSTFTFHGYVWDASGVAVFPFSILFDISLDGTTAVGRTPNGAARWTVAGGLEVIPLPPSLQGGNLSTEAFRVSADGSVITGSFSGPGEIPKRWRWSVETGGVELTPPVGYDSSSVVELSDDGESILGLVGGSSENARAALWTTASGWTLLPPLADGSLPARLGDISADGSVVIGTARDPLDSNAFIPMIWSAAEGSHDLFKLLADEYGLGASVVGWNPRRQVAVAISADGKTIAGYGRNAQGNLESWVAYLGDPVPEPGAVVLAALAMIPISRRRRRVRNFARSRSVGADQ